MRGLGELESAVMDRLWRWARPATVRDVVDDLNAVRPLAYTTVQTVMDNLFRKGWLTRALHGRAYRYEPTITRQAAAARLMREALSAGEDHHAVFAHFLAQMDPDESRALRTALRRLRRAAP
ncbi:MAG TPA: BlaI/MecI/CopY family transcriptional regulator [Jiangellales bacterium]|nr:BlaI/MecI/CopY family transcriptional regulator [Jiangellales bacterium]